ncbi:MAG: M23 family metallopeptidase [Candidatus Peribacteraceae bacterium]|nr:M23 family metallopeptidase [Candidatus Peribacteraceae bacterium]
MHLTSSKRMGFSATPLHCKREPHAFHFLSQRASFWIASLSLLAFVIGNMIGQHGWYVFWKSVLGKVDDSAILYTGTVTPVEWVPDMLCWAKYGGDPSTHAFRQVPKDCLMGLPSYDAVSQRDASKAHGYGNDLYSVGYLGSYTTGAEGTGSHPGVDIRMPVGTPVRAIANGIVVRSESSNGGFGKVIVIKHPNAPDPSDPKKTTTLYSNYAHLSALYVSEGAVVQKGEHIGDSGVTGAVSGPHLHFQIDRDAASWHPYWLFSDTEARAEGLTSTQALNTGLFQSRGSVYTVNPMLFVQANYSVADQLIASNDKEQGKTVSSSSSSAGVRSAVQQKAIIQSRSALRMQARIARANAVSRIVSQRTISTQENSVIRSRETVAATDAVAAAVTATQKVASVQISHGGTFSGRGWEKVSLTLLDDNGGVVKSPELSQDIYLRTAYGNAEFRPAVLSTLDFINGEATVNVLPRGRRTVVIEVKPLNAMSRPMVYQK